MAVPSVKVKPQEHKHITTTPSISSLKMAYTKGTDREALSPPKDPMHTHHKPKKAAGTHLSQQ